MTDLLQILIASAVAEVKRNPCDDGEHAWSSDGEGGRACPTGCDQCSQTVYRCQVCGVYDYGSGDDSPGLRDCKAVCGDSMEGWRGGHLDTGEELTA